MDLLEPEQAATLERLVGAPVRPGATYTRIALTAPWALGGGEEVPLELLPLALRLGHGLVGVL